MTSQQHQSYGMEAAPVSYPGTFGAPRPLFMKWHHCGGMLTKETQNSDMMFRIAYTVQCLPWKVPSTRNARHHDNLNPLRRITTTTAHQTRHMKDMAWT